MKLNVTPRQNVDADTSRWYREIAQAVNERALIADLNGTPSDGTVTTAKLAAVIAPTVSSLNGGQLAGLRNRIINGGMAVAQRGNAVLSNNSIVYGGADRWMTGLFNFTTAAGTVGQLAGQPVTSSSTGFMHSLSGLTTTGAGLVHFRQRIEAVNAFGLNGKTVTVSGNVAQDTGATQSLTVRLNKANSTDNFGATTLIANSTTTTVASGVLTRFTATFNLAATDASNGLELVLEYAGVGAFTSKSFYLGDVQLEPGSVATPFEHRPYGMELALCKRYFESISLVGYGGATNPTGYVTSVVLPTVAVLNLSYASTKRNIPTISTYGTIQIQQGAGVPGTITTCVAINNQGSVYMNGSGFTVGVGHVVGSTASKLEISSEL